MNVNDPGTAFLFIMQFIHKFGVEDEGTNYSSSLSLLEEIREIGFDKIIDTNDEFSRLKLKMPFESYPTLNIKILRNQNYEYSFDSFPDCPVSKIKDSKQGFLGRILKLATNDFIKYKKICNEIFFKIDEEFPTLKPERNSNQILKRRILCGTEDILEISYGYKSNQIQINSSSKSYFIDDPFEIFSELKKIFIPIAEIEKDCGICYSNYLDGQIAELKCPSCCQIYHETCLREWYISNPEFKTLFDKIFGKCLFCNEVR